jgi:hypothetical protein
MSHLSHSRDSIIILIIIVIIIIIIIIIIMTVIILTSVQDERCVLVVVRSFRVAYRNDPVSRPCCLQLFDAPFSEWFG